STSPEPKSLRARKSKPLSFFGPGPERPGGSFPFAATVPNARLPRKELPGSADEEPRGGVTAGVEAPGPKLAAPASGLAKVDRRAGKAILGRVEVRSGSGFGRPRSPALWARAASGRAAASPRRVKGGVTAAMANRVVGPHSSGSTGPRCARGLVSKAADDA